MNKPFIDYLGNEIKVGDFVLYSTGSGRSSSAQNLGVVEKVEYTEIGYRKELGHRIRVYTISQETKWNENTRKSTIVGWKEYNKRAIRTLENTIKFPANLIGDKKLKALVESLQIKANIKLE